MTEFKKGDRVQWIGEISGKRFVGTVEHIDPGGVVRGSQDNGQPFRKYPEYLTKITDPAPLRFEDVRTGDQITVEVRPEDYPPYTMTGVAKTVGPDLVVIPGAAFSASRVGSPRGTWYECSEDRTVILTAHTPAEPEWHRAKVIKADVKNLPGYSRLLIEDAHMVRHPDLGWTDDEGNHWESEELTNVTIIVDEHGQVRA